MNRTNKHIGYAVAVVASFAVLLIRVALSDILPRASSADAVCSRRHGGGLEWRAWAGRLGDAAESPARRVLYRPAGQFVADYDRGRWRERRVVRASGAHYQLAV